VEWVPAYKSVTIYYNPGEILYHELRDAVYELGNETKNIENHPNRVVHVPVLYGGEEGPDLERLAKHANLEKNDVITLHKEPLYFVNMLGFLPGFPYLSGLNPKLVIPRLKNPRGRIPAGSIGIAHEQTGIYPTESPGGWNIIGRTPLTLFAPLKQVDVFLFQPGDSVKFYEITKQEFHDIELQLEKEEFQVRVDYLK
jgi:inhibitor of KinA